MSTPVRRYRRYRATEVNTGAVLSGRSGSSAPRYRGQHRCGAMRHRAISIAAQYSTYCDDEQRRQPGWIVVQIVADIL
jgi:hypothetical protein